ncbi:MAG: DMT family transporter [Thermoleophilia bacterium]|nr:DMT family transporter [Gaiellaceae bacterium]MDW8338498.1 DMT family transporter [Thermoleophilia bacterium]
MSSTGLAATAALCAGLAGALQIAVQGRLGERVGSLEAVATAVLVGSVVAFALLLALRRSLGGVGEALSGPKWQLLGGVCSVVIVLGITYAAARIGVVATTAFLIAAQFALAALIDRFGWFGVERVALTWPRVAGICLLALGAALTLRR